LLISLKECWTSIYFIAQLLINCYLVSFGVLRRQLDKTINKMAHIKFLIPFILIILVSCSKNNQDIENSVNSKQGSWLVDVNDIIHLDAEKDPIESVDSPEFVEISSSLLDDEEIVLSYLHNDVVHVYPMSVMEAHEIVNDSIDDYFFAITHCPLTGSSIAWNRSINGEPSSFGVSGKLYKENLIPYDRNSGSNWSQMLSLCINGSNIGELAQTTNLVRTKFSTIKRSFPEALVLNHESCDSDGCVRNLKSVGDEPVGGADSDINDAEKYFGIVDGERATLIPLSKMKEEITVLHILAHQKRNIVVSSKNMSFMVVFNIGTSSFTAIQDSLPIVMKDGLGNYYDLFGRIVSGPELGNRLISPTSYHANTFAWKDIFKSIEIIE